MSRKFYILSITSFLISSLSILFIPFVTTEDGMNNWGYIIAVVFWIGLISGIIFAIIMNRSVKNKRKNNKSKKKKVYLTIGFILFLLLIIEIIFFNQNTMLMSINIACMLFDFELYFIEKEV